MAILGRTPFEQVRLRPAEDGLLPESAGPVPRRGGPQVVGEAVHPSEASGFTGM